MNVGGCIARPAAERDVCDTCSQHGQTERAAWVVPTMLGLVKFCERHAAVAQWACEEGRRIAASAGLSMMVPEEET